MLNLVRVNAQISMIVQSVFDEYELSATAYGVLEVLINSAEPVTPSVISRRMLLPPQALSHQLNRLESAACWFAFDTSTTAGASWCSSRTPAATWFLQSPAR